MEVSSSLGQLVVELNPGSPFAPPGGELLHVRAVGDNDTLHFLFCSQGAPTLLLVHTNTSSSTVKVCFYQSSLRRVSITCRRINTMILNPRRSDVASDWCAPDHTPVLNRSRVSLSGELESVCVS